MSIQVSEIWGQRPCPQSKREEYVLHADSLSFNQLVNILLVFVKIKPFLI